MWETPRAEVVWEAAGMQSDMTYIGRRQATMAQWVALRPLFKVCTREKGYKGGGRRRKAWWRQDVTEKQLQATLAGILCEDKRKGIIGENVMQLDPEGGGRAGWEVGMLGRRRETPRWANDLMW